MPTSSIPTKNHTTTPQQRRRLFESWEASGNVQAACQQVGVSIRTFYYWKKRFDESGYAALETTRSHAPKNPNRIPPKVESLIIELKQCHPDWGKLRIANEVIQRFKSLASISPNTVRRVLMDAGLWQ